VLPIEFNFPLQTGEVTIVETRLRTRVASGRSGMFDQNISCTTVRSSCSSFSVASNLPRENSLSSRP